MWRLDFLQEEERLWSLTVAKQRTTVATLCTSYYTCMGCLHDLINESLIFMRHSFEMQAYTIGLGARFLRKEEGIRDPALDCKRTRIISRYASIPSLHSCTATYKTQRHYHAGKFDAYTVDDEQWT